MANKLSYNFKELKIHGPSILLCNFKNVQLNKLNRWLQNQMQKKRDISNVGCHDDTT